MIGLARSEALQTKKMKMKMKVKSSKVKPFFRYNNYHDLVSGGLLYLGIIRVFYINDDLTFLSTVLYSLLGVYILFVLILSRFSFYENHIEIRFPARFWSKGKVINYDEIIKIKELSFRYNRGYIIITKVKFLNTVIGRPSNSFPCNRRKKREKLVEFLKSKNVEVEIT